MTHQKRIAAMIAEIEAMDGLTGVQEDAAIEAIDALVELKLSFEDEYGKPVCFSSDPSFHAHEGTYGEFRG